MSISNVDFTAGLDGRKLEWLIKF